MIRHLLVAIALSACALIAAADGDDQADLPIILTPEKPVTGTANGAGSSFSSGMDAPKPQVTGTEPIVSGTAAPLPTAHATTRPPADVTSERAPLPVAEDIESTWHLRNKLPPRLGEALTLGKPSTRPIAANYPLRAGDRVRVVIWGGRAANERLPIAITGDLPIPGFGMVPVAGLTQAEAQARVLELVRSQFKQGGAVVALEEPSPQAVTVVGEVSRPGYLTLLPGGTVIEALTAAGGVLPQGSLRRIRITSGETVQEMDLYRVAVDGDASLLQPLAPGSLVFVPLAGAQVAVFGAVRRSSLIELLPEQPLAEALRLAGGPTADADITAIRVLHEGPSGQRLEQLTSANLGGKPAADGDRLLAVQRRTLLTTDTAVEVKGSVRSPGLYSWKEGLTLATLIDLAGGALPNIDRPAIIIRRLLDQPRAIDLGNGASGVINYETLPGLDATIQLRPRDVVEVPALPKPEDSLLAVSISGAVKRPGRFPLGPGMHLREALGLAGLTLPTAQVDQADLVRSVILADGRRDVSRETIDLRPILARNEPGPALLPGDMIVVRSVADARIKVSINGQFRNTGTFTLPAGTTIGQLATMAGGLQPEAFPRGMRFFREQEKTAAQEFLRDLATRLETSIHINQRGKADAPGDDERGEVERTIARQQADLARVRQAVATGRLGGIDLERILSGDAKADQILQDGDRIELPAKPGSIRVLGEVMVPGSLVFHDELSVKEVVARSGGMTRQADADSVFVVRADGSVVATAQGDTLAWDHDRRKWARTSLRGLTLMEGDAVIVPADVRYTDSNRRVVRDWTQIMFQVAATVGTIAVLAK